MHVDEKDADYPKDWLTFENANNKLLGDRWIQDNQYLAFKVRSAVNPSEYNILLNPLFPRYRTLVNILSVELLRTDARLRKNFP